MQERPQEYPGIPLAPAHMPPEALVLVSYSRAEPDNKKQTQTSKQTNPVSQYIPEGGS